MGKTFSPRTAIKKDAPNQGILLHIIFEFYLTPCFYQNISFPMPQALFAPVCWRRINDGLWQFDLIWILTFFLAGHSVLPQQQNLSGSTQSISHSFPAIHSCQRLFPYTEGKQIILKPEKILIELLSHPFPSGVFAGKARTK